MHKLLLVPLPHKNFAFLFNTLRPLREINAFTIKIF
jgi:hypothetical protein